MDCLIGNVCSILKYKVTLLCVSALLWQNAFICFGVIQIVLALYPVKWSKSFTVSGNAIVQADSSMCYALELEMHMCGAWYIHFEVWMRNVTNYVRNSWKNLFT